MVFRTGEIKNFKLCHPSGQIVQSFVAESEFTGFHGH